MNKGRPNPFLFFLLMFLMIFLVIDPVIRYALALGLGFVLGPSIGFGGNYPIITILLSSVIVTTITLTFRHLVTDYLEVAEVQHYLRHISKLFREAIREGNKEKINKLREIQFKYAEKSMKQSYSQMKITFVTMLLVLGIFAWLWLFVTESPYPYVAVPWNNFVDLRGVNFLPNWILLYSLFASGLSLFLGQILKFLKLKKVFVNENRG